VIYYIACPCRKPRWFYEEAAKEYEKRLSRFCRVVRADHCDPGGEGDYVIGLSPDGAQLSSEDMANRFLSMESRGAVSRIIFVVEGNMSIHVDETWALISIRLPEDLTVVLLLEQIYRAQKILHHEPYHK